MAKKITLGNATIELPDEQADQVESWHRAQVQEKVELAKRLADYVTKDDKSKVEVDSKKQELDKILAQKVEELEKTHKETLSQLENRLKTYQSKAKESSLKSALEKVPNIKTSLIDLLLTTFNDKIVYDDQKGLLPLKDGKPVEEPVDKFLLESLKDKTDLFNSPKAATTPMPNNPSNTAGELSWDELLKK